MKPKNYLPVVSLNVKVLSPGEQPGTGWQIVEKTLNNEQKLRYAFRYTEGPAILRKSDRGAGNIHVPAGPLNLGFKVMNAADHGRFYFYGVYTEGNQIHGGLISPLEVAIVDENTESSDSKHYEYTVVVVDMKNRSGADKKTACQIFCDPRVTNEPPPP